MAFITNENKDGATTLAKRLTRSWNEAGLINEG